MLHRTHSWVRIKINGVKVSGAQVLIELGDTIEIGGKPIRILEGEVGF